ncbi:MAG: tyrosine-protein phosphatase [Acidobacteria bacterium]|nr:tyrosine-protein phosphatase [Acidobacteriota bacterium]
MDGAVAEVTVEPDGAGALLVAWQIEGPDIAVDVSAGPTPEAVDHAHSVTVRAGTHSVRLDGLGPGRHYVSVAPAGSGPGLVAAERRLPFEGVTNFRDLGGYLTAGGGRTRWGLVFRADALHRFTAADLALYERLGMRVVYDLRGDLEREARPNPMPSVQLALLSRVREEGVASDRSGESAHDGERFLREIYKGMLEHAGPLIGRLLTGLTDPDGLPAVFHCAGGKDRTGLTAALLLELVGVARDDVLDDYELTARYRRREHQEDSFEHLVAGGVAPEAAASMLGAPRWAMEETLEELDEAYGGVEAYLTGPAGMAAADLDALRARLVNR